MITGTERIGAITYTVSRVPRSEIGDNNGLATYALSRIDIADDLGEQAASVVLWHERIHAMLWDAGISTHPERLIDAIAHGVVAWQRDNGGGGAGRAVTATS